MARLHLVVYGTVQGVGFRAFARRAAAQIGVRAGWVRNRPDGAVEIEAEGSDDAVARFAELVRRGPGYGRVERVDTLPPSIDPLPAPFAIVR